MILLLCALVTQAGEPLHWSGSLGGSPPITADANYVVDGDSRLLELSFSGATEWQVTMTVQPVGTSRRETLSIVRTSEQSSSRNSWSMMTGDLNVFTGDEANKVQATKAEVMFLLVPMRKQMRLAKKAATGGAWRVETAELNSVLNLAKPLGGADESPSVEVHNAPKAAPTIDLRSVEERACPHSLNEQELAGGKVIRTQPSLLCYEEQHPGRAARVFFAVEGSVKADSWGKYARMVRQILVSWQSDGATWDVRFVTDPRADARGVTIWKRDGQELMEIRRTRDDTLESARFILYSTLDGTGIIREDENFFDARNPRVERLMERLRNVGYRAHRQLSGYIVDSNQVPNANPIVITDEDLGNLMRIVTELVAGD